MIDFGLGIGEDWFEDVLEDSFDEIVKLFIDLDEGIVIWLYEFFKEYIFYSGLISLRECVVKDDCEDLYD